MNISILFDTYRYVLCPMNNINTSDKFVVFQQWHCHPCIGVGPSASFDVTKSELVGGVVGHDADDGDDDSSAGDIVGDAIDGDRDDCDDIIAELISVDSVADLFILNLSDITSNEPW